MKRNVKILSLVMAVAMMLSVTGCLPAPAAPVTDTPVNEGVDFVTPMDPAQREKVSLEIWYAVSGTSGEKFVEQATAFDESNDLVDLELSYSGGANDTSTKVSAALLTDTAPDIALMYAGPSYTGGRNDFTMDQLIQREGFNADDIFPGMWDYCKYYTSDAVCAVPYGISTQVMYYNKDILAAAGVDMTNPPKTWDEFYEVCLKCLENGNINNTEDFTAFDVTDTGWLFKSMAMQNGCPIVESTPEDGVTPVFNNEAAIQVAEYWKKMVDAGIMAPGEHNVAENKFLSGNLAFLAMSSNRISRWTDVDINIGAIEMPYFNTPSVALGGSVIAVFTQDPQKIEAAWEFVDYMLEVERQTDFALSTGYLPVRQSALDLPAVQDAISNNDMYNIAFNQLSYTWAYVHFEQMGTMDLQIADALSRVEKGTLQPQEAFDAAVNRVIDELAVDAQ